jgi:hypothetical protein
MRSTFLVVSATLLVSGVAPALAAPKNNTAAKPTFETCEALAVERALYPNQGPSTTQDSPFNSFIRACLAGKIPFAAPVSKENL